MIVKLLSISPTHWTIHERDGFSLICVNPHGSREFSASFLRSYVPAHKHCFQTLISPCSNSTFRLEHDLLRLTSIPIINEAIFLDKQKLSQDLSGNRWLLAQVLHLKLSDKGRADNFRWENPNGRSDLRMSKRESWLKSFDGKPRDARGSH
jgi:hypothetical protein